MNSQSDLPVFDFDIFSSPIHQPALPFGMAADYGTPFSGYEARIETIPAVLDDYPLFDLPEVRPICKQTAPLPIPMIASGGSIPSIFRPFASLESAELTVQQLRGVLRRTEHRIRLSKQ
jgi:hypothetical protein